jgi:hypothetical protein
VHCIACPQDLFALGITFIPHGARSSQYEQLLQGTQVEDPLLSLLDADDRLPKIQRARPITDGKRRRSGRSGSRKRKLKAAKLQVEDAVVEEGIDGSSTIGSDSDATVAQVAQLALHTRGPNLDRPPAASPTISILAQPQTRRI